MNFRSDPVFNNININIKVLNRLTEPQGIFKCSRGEKWGVLFIEDFLLYPPVPLLQANEKP